MFKPWKCSFSFPQPRSRLRIHPETDGISNGTGNTNMKKYILIFSHPTDALARFEALVPKLGHNKTRKVVPLLPHAILFEHEENTSRAYKEVATYLGPSDQVLIFPLSGMFCGSLHSEQMNRVNEFLRP
jgi:hypothetical protein